jgi:Na+-translocating ferredoxin:NAD+ oxidoreductase RnfC subunit
MSRSETTLRIDATHGLKIRPGDKIQEGQHISTNQEQAVMSPVSGTVKSVRFDPDNHEFLVVVSLTG